MSMYTYNERLPTTPRVGYTRYQYNVSPTVAIFGTFSVPYNNGIYTNQNTGNEKIVITFTGIAAALFVSGDSSSRSNVSIKLDGGTAEIKSQLLSGNGTINCFYSVAGLTYGVHAIEITCTNNTSYWGLAYVDINTNTTMDVSGLDAYYPLATDYTDQSGNSRDCTAVGTVNIVNKWAEFIGSNNYLTAGYGYYPASISLLFTCFPTNNPPPARGEILVSVRGIGDFAEGVSCFEKSGKIGFVGNLGGNVYDNSPSFSVTQGVPVSVAITIDDATKKIKIYKDGLYNSEASYTGNIKYGSVEQIRIGTGYPYYMNDETDNKIKEVRVYNKALTATEIWSIYNPNENSDVVSFEYFTKLQTSDFASFNYILLSSELEWTAIPTVEFYGISAEHIRVGINSIGTIYYTVLPSGSSTPTSLQIKNGVSGALNSISLSSTEANLIIDSTDWGVTYLQYNSSYDFYFTAEDNFGNLMANDNVYKITSYTEQIKPEITYETVESGARVSISTTYGEVYYTLDGSAPNESSNIYSIPFLIDRPRLIKAKYFGSLGGVTELYIYVNSSPYSVFICDKEYDENGVKHSRDITSYIDSEININESANDSISTIDNLSFYFPTNSLNSNIQFLSSNVLNVVGSALYIQKNNDIIFNGVINSINPEVIGDINGEYIKYSCNVIHKSKELDRIIINNKINSIGISAGLYVSQLISNSNKLLKYNQLSFYDSNFGMSYNSLAINSDTLYLEKDKMQFEDNIRIGDIINNKYLITEINKNIITNMPNTSYQLTNINTNYYGTLLANVYNTGENQYTLYLTDVNYVNIAYAIMLDGVSQYELIPISDNGFIGNVTMSQYGTKAESLYMTIRTQIMKLKIHKLAEETNNSIFIGYKANNQLSSSIPIYDNQYKLKTISAILNELSEKYYFGFYVDNMCKISLFDNLSSIDNNTISISKDLSSIANSVVQKFSLSTEVDSILNSLYSTGYTELDRNEYLNPIINTTSIQNVWAKIPETNAIPDTEKSIQRSGSDELYFLLGNSTTKESPYFNIPLNTDVLLNDSHSFLKKINIETGRINNPNSLPIFFQIEENNAIKYSTIINPVDKIEIQTIFLDIHKDKEYRGKISTLLEVSPCVITNIVKTSWFIVSCSSIGALTEGNRYVFVDSLNNILGTAIYYTQYGSTDLVFKIEESYNMDYFLTANFNDVELYEVGQWDNNTESSTYGLIELKYTSIEENGIDYFIEGTPSVLQSTYTYQVGYVFSYPTVNNGSSFDGKYSFYYVKPNTDSKKIYIVNEHGSSANPLVLDWLKPRFTYDLVFIEIYNNQTQQWILKKVKQYYSDDVGYVIEPYEDTTVTSDWCNLINGNELTTFRRVFITTSSSLSDKPVDDEIYDAYISNNRSAYGFNKAIEQDSIDNYQGIVPSEGTVSLYMILEKGSIMGVSILVEIPYLKYTSSQTSINKYGYYEEVQSNDFKSNSEYQTYSISEIRNRSIPKLNGSISMKEDIVKTYFPTINIDDVRYISLNSKINNKDTLFIITKKTKIINLRMQNNREMYYSFDIEEMR